MNIARHGLIILPYIATFVLDYISKKTQKFPVFSNNNKTYNLSTLIFNIGCVSIGYLFNYISETIKKALTLREKDEILKNTYWNFVFDINKPFIKNKEREKTGNFNYVFSNSINTDGYSVSFGFERIFGANISAEDKKALTMTYKELPKHTTVDLYSELKSNSEVGKHLMKEFKKTDNNKRRIVACDPGICDLVYCYSPIEEGEINKCIAEVEKIMVINEMKRLSNRQKSLLSKTNPTTQETSELANLNTTISSISALLPTINLLKTKLIFDHKKLTPLIISEINKILKLKLSDDQLSKLKYKCDKKGVTMNYSARERSRELCTKILIARKNYLNTNSTPKKGDPYFVPWIDYNKVVPPEYKPTNVDVCVKINNKIENKKVNDIIYNCYRWHNRSMDIDYLKKICIERNSVLGKMLKHCGKSEYKAIEWQRYMYSQKAERKFIQKYESKYGKNTIIIYGNFEVGDRKYGKAPTMNKGLQNILRKYGHLVVKVDEFNTSKKCCNCLNNLYHNTLIDQQFSSNGKKISKDEVKKIVSSNIDKKKSDFLATHKRSPNKEEINEIINTLNHKKTITQTQYLAEEEKRESNKNKTNKVECKKLCWGLKKCDNCNFVINRDLNGAKNIFTKGIIIFKDFKNIDKNHALFLNHDDSDDAVVAAL